jgi:two-component system nitrate/nitrite response regulator NarL
VQSGDIQIQVVIADDHPVYREGVARSIRERPEFSVAAECADGEEALTVIESVEPELALLDVRMPGLDGIDVLKQLRVDGHTSTRVVMLSAIDDGTTVYESIAAGASGYLSKDSGREEICDALVAVAAGHTVLPADLHNGLAETIRHHADAASPLLTEREREVLQWAAEGRTAKEVAEQLIIGTATVKTHLQHIYEKLGVADRAAAVAEAMRRGLLD